MHSTSPSLPLASIFGMNMPELMGFGIPIAGMIFGGIMAFMAMYFHHQRQRLKHETARLALEKGLPVPTFSEDKTHQPKSKGDLSLRDLRGGLVLIGLGAGIYLFFANTGGANEARFLGAIPGFIGIALLLHALLQALLTKKESAPEDRPLQS